MAPDPRVVRVLQPAQAGAVQHAYAQSFLSGFHLALLVAAIVLFLGAAVAYRWIPHGAPRREEMHEAPAERAVALTAD